jgi:hypothetical protein
VLNSYAQNSKESLKWRIKMEDNVCLAEINIGTLSASAVKSNKRQAKLLAAKNLLRTIDSNTFLKGKFFYYLRDQRDFQSQTNRSNSWADIYHSYKEVAEPAPAEIHLDMRVDGLQNVITDEEARGPEEVEDEDEIFEVEALYTEDSLDLKKWFNTLDASLKPMESQLQEINQIFMQVSEVVKALLPGGFVKVIPLGSYLLGCMRRDHLVVDCLLLDSRLPGDSLGLSPAQEINLSRLKELFQERKSTFQLINNHYQLYEVRAISPQTEYEETGALRCLYFTHSLTGIKIKIINFVDKGGSYVNCRGKTVNLFNSTLFHVMWLEQQYTREPVSQEISKLLRIIRKWRTVNQVTFPSEIIDLAVVYSTYNFKELDLVKVLLKFFALINLLVNNYHHYFYELSEYHSFIIKVNVSDQNISDEDKLQLIKRAQETFVEISNRNPAHFG